jgi:hypothetical protein
MTPEDLRKLADEATPGPWEYHAGIPSWEPAVAMTGSVYARDDYRPLAEKPRTADARLIALAPDLARLCAELGEALEHIQEPLLENPPMNDYERYVAERSGRALAKLSELEADS